MEAKLEYMKWQRNKFLSNEEMMELKSFRENDDLIEELFGRDLEFEEDGVTGELGLGMSRMNNYQMARAIQAFSNDLMTKSGGRVGKGVAVSFDTRNMSEEFSDLVSRMLLGNGIGTALFLKPTSVAQMSFAIRYLDLEGGIMVTAGSEPKQYNGVRFFSNQGEPMSEMQISTLIDEFYNIQQFSQIHEYVGFLRLNSIHHKIGPANDFKYRKELMRASVCSDIDRSVKIVYTPLYGTGGFCFKELMKEAGFTSVSYVESQMKADPEFPGIDAPDPEKADSLKCAIELAEKEEAELVLATNTDCSKMGAAVRNADGSYAVLKRDEILKLISDYMAENDRPEPEDLKLMNPEGDGILACMLMAELTANRINKMLK